MTLASHTAIKLLEFEARSCLRASLKIINRLRLAAKKVRSNRRIRGRRSKPENRFIRREINRRNSWGKTGIYLAFA